jgi:hypothetical protein
MRREDGADGSRMGRKPDFFARPRGQWGGWAIDGRDTYLRDASCVAWRIGAYTYVTYASWCKGGKKRCAKGTKK